STGGRSGSWACAVVARTAMSHGATVRHRPGLEMPGDMPASWTVVVGRMALAMAGGQMGRCASTRSRPRPSRRPRTRCLAGRRQAVFARGRTPPPARRSAGLVPVRLAQRFAALGEGVEVGQEAGEAAQVLGVVLGHLAQ